jgi:hypothetical protein
LNRRNVAQRSKARHGRDATARPKVVHPPGGEIGIGLRSRARYVDGQNVARLFKWIKQHLRIKVFFGTSENAVKTQIWIAISTYLLIAIAKKRLHLDHHSLYEILQILSLSMFETIPINQLLTPPSTISDADFEPNQLALL